MTATMDDAAIDLARECLYRFLAAVLSDPCGARFRLAENGSTKELACHAADLLRADGAEDDLTCDDLCRHLDRPRDDLAGEYRRVFGMSASVFPPLETEFFPNQEPFFRAQQMADVAGFYKAFGLSPSRREAERVDHIALEMEFLACLLAKSRLATSPEDRDVCASAAETFFREHLGWWVPAFARGLEWKAAGGLYDSVARALAAFIAFERRRWPVEPARVPLPEAIVDAPDDGTGCAACSA